MNLDFKENILEKCELYWLVVINFENSLLLDLNNFSYVTIATPYSS